MIYVYMNRKQAENIGMAASVAGGWVRADMMVDSSGTLHTSQHYAPDLFPALVPDSFERSNYVRQASQQEIETAIAERESADKLLAAWSAR